MWNEEYRKRIWSQLDQEWDLIIIGGGITGAGVLREAVMYGLRALLVEAHDFAFGTSSRSSKLVHGGFRYLRNGQFSVTRESVREREWLLRDARHLVTELPFIMPYYGTQRMRGLQYRVGVVVYDLMAPKWNHCKFTPSEVMERSPLLRSENLRGGVQYYDARLDDSRLVLRVLREAYAQGGVALNYARASQFLRTRDGSVCGILLQDTANPSQPAVEVRAKVVINAAGPWSDEVRSHLGAPPHLRRLRGSHVIFPYSLYPLDHSVALVHPRDHRSMFAIPWEGTTIFGTTDLDHRPGVNEGEPYASDEEIDYILEVIHSTFPGVPSTRDQLISTFAGLRPVINGGKANPSKESRAHIVLEEDGLITVTGGKLTTFRIMAQEALQHASPRLPGQPKFKSRMRLFNSLPRELPKAALTQGQAVYLLGRYGEDTLDLLSSAIPDEVTPIEMLPNLWAELRWAARSEAVVHLDDLLLRRVRLGLLLPGGGMGQMERIRQTVQAELGWDDRRWKQEVADYQKLWQRFYSPSPLG